MSPPLLQPPPSPTAATVKDYAADRRGIGLIVRDYGGAVIVVV